MATTHLGSRHCITLAILVDRCNYSEFYFDVVNTKSTKLNLTLLKSIKDFKPKLHSYPNVPPIFSFKTTTISVAFISLFPNSIDRLGTR